MYPGEYIDLLGSFHWQLLYIRLAKVAYNITTTIPIDYKQGYFSSLLSPSFKALYLTFVSCNH